MFFGYGLPSFIKPLPASVGPDEMRLLQRKAAFDLPPPWLQDLLLKSYLECFHPFMPLLDADDLVLPGRGGDGCRREPVSLLLYQCVLFAGTSFIDPLFLQKAGYRTRKMARETSFAKVRALYDLDCEKDRLTVAQALLIMTFCYETLGDQKDAYHWAGLAVSMAYKMELHVGPRQPLHRRVWWSCFIRDRLVSLALGRPMHIKTDGGLSVAMVEESDMDVGRTLAALRALDPRLDAAAEMQKQRVLGQLFVAKVKLCVCIGAVLDGAYADDDGGRDMSRIKWCDAQLQGWAQSLSRPCRRHLPPGRGGGGGDGEVAIRNLLHLGFHTAVLALHSPLAVSSTTMRHISRRRVRTSAMHVASLVSELQAIHSGRYLPTNGVAAFIPAIIFHLLDADADAHADACHTPTAVLHDIPEICSQPGSTWGFFDAALTQVVNKIRSSLNGDGLANTPNPLIDRQLTPTPSLPQRTQWGPSSDILGFPTYRPGLYGSPDGLGLLGADAQGAGPGLPLCPENWNLNDLPPPYRRDVAACW